ncbi:hypothetical protein MBELCI_2356 [Limimaricola cinnabarinus LL-001]|uniref:Uncharacterized protein n=1 Tax=Limimaricola cinnabarinus LL-001 TaxID=1337093 RepID=U3AF56_9RHOB|nr:hypothetical protein MBELCI_2356 [Limimaricola cinnabarinus LL-001]
MFVALYADACICRGRRTVFSACHRFTLHDLSGGQAIPVGDVPHGR